MKASEGRIGRVFVNIWGLKEIPRLVEMVQNQARSDVAGFLLLLTVPDAPTVAMRAAALDLFHQGIRATEDFDSPRAWAFTIVGVHAYLRRYSGDINRTTGAPPNMKTGQILAV